MITRRLLGQVGLKPDEADSGAVTLIQRFGYAANLNVHLYRSVLDGVYRRGVDGAPAVVEASAPTIEAFGPRAGQKVLAVQGAMPSEKNFKQTLCVDIDGFSLHPAVLCAADDWQALEQLCRYSTRPALANERVQTNAAGQGALKLKTPLAQRGLTISIHHRSGGPALRAAGVGCVRVVAPPMETAWRPEVTRRRHPEKRHPAGLSTPNKLLLHPRTNSSASGAVHCRVLPCSECHGDEKGAFKNSVLGRSGGAVPGRRDSGRRRSGQRQR